MKHTIGKKWLAGILAGAMVVSMTACNGSKQAENQGSEVIYAENGVYPISCEDELTVWMTLNNFLSTEVTNFGETELAQELKKNTGINVQYLHPSQGGESEQFNLLIASGDLPDIIQYDWTNYGAQAAIDDGVILSLNDELEKWAPNLTKVLKDYPNYDKMVKTDEGNYYVFPCLAGEGKFKIYTGPVVREDWLDKLGMDAPETIDDWDTMLRGFKNKLNADLPLSTSANYLTTIFSGAYGVYSGVYLQDGKLVYGQIQDGWKDLLKQLNTWYNDGLIDQSLASFDTNLLTTNMLNDRVGATFTGAASGVGRWRQSRTDGADFRPIGVQYPVLNKGDRPGFSTLSTGYYPGSSFAISGKCKNPELAVRFMDYGYTEEGSMLYNLGIEGVTYEFDENGEFKFTDSVLNYKEGFQKGIIRYAMGGYSGPFLMDKRIDIGLLGEPKEAFEATSTWMETDMEEHVMPPLTYTTEEQSELSGIRSELDTYVGEMTLKFITGAESLDQFEEYQERLKAFRVDRLLELTEAALERYNKR